MAKHRRQHRQPHRGDQQRVELDRYLQTYVYAAISRAFADADTHTVAPVRAAFIRAYTAEWDRLTKQLTASLGKDASSREVIAQRAAQLRHWLIVSGWRMRLLAVYRQAAQHAGQQSLATIEQAQKPILAVGWNHARMLLVEAMQPALRAGMPWRPKP